MFFLIHGVPHLDAQHVLSGIVYVTRNGCIWKDVPNAYGQHKVLYDRIIRTLLAWSIQRHQ